MKYLLSSSFPLSAIISPYLRPILLCALVSSQPVCLFLSFPHSRLFLPYSPLPDPRIVLSQYQQKLNYPYNLGVTPNFVNIRKGLTFDDPDFGGLPSGF